eukprot:RCo053395
MPTPRAQSPKKTANGSSIDRSFSSLALSAYLILSPQFLTPLQTHKLSSSYCWQGDVCERVCLCLRLCCLVQPALALEQQVVLGGQPDEDPEKVLNARLLTGQRIDHRSALGHQRGLAKVAQNGQHAVELLPLPIAGGAERDSLHELREDGKVQDKRCSQETVLARVVEDKRVAATHEDLRGVLIHGALAVANRRNVLDHHAVVRMLARRVQEGIARHHVVHNAGLGNFLRAELRRRRQILAIVVPEMVVASNSQRLDPRTHEELHQQALQLGLPRLKVITRNEHAVVLCQLNDPGHEGVLGAAVDVRAALQDRRRGVHRRRRDLGLVVLDGLQQALLGIVQTLVDFREALGVGRP